MNVIFIAKDKSGPDRLVVTIPCDLSTQRLSSQGKTRIVATSSGNQPTTITHKDGSVVRVGLTAFCALAGQA